MSVPTRTQVSAGGVVFRGEGASLEVVLISVVDGDAVRWQLPKGIVDAEESPEQTALREVQEETGLEATLVGPIDTIDYWYYGSGGKVRFHKFVHFFLMRYQRGSTADHDHEVAEARWMAIDEAILQLAFKNEQEIVAQAVEMIEKLGSEGEASGPPE